MIELNADEKIQNFDEKRQFYTNLYTYNKGIKSSTQLKREINNIFKKINIKRVDTILDLGSGPGVISKILSDNFKKSIICLDYSFDALRHAKKLCDPINAIQGDGYYLPLKKNSVDVIFIREFSILNDQNFIQTQEYLESLHDLLKENGYLIIIHSSNLTNHVKNGWIHYDYSHFKCWENLQGYETNLFYKISVLNLFPISPFFTTFQLKLVKLLKGRFTGRFILISQKKSHKKKIVICSYDFFYDTRKYGLHYLSEYFMRNNQIFYITVRNIFNDLLKKNLVKKRIIDKKNKNNKNLKTSVSYILLSPMQMLPLINSYMYAKKFLNFSFPNIKKILRKNGFFNCDIVMFETNSRMAIMSIINSKFSIYRLCDPYDGYNYISKGQLKFEKEIIKTASIVLAVSTPLYDFAVKTKESTQGIYLLPNGVDIEIFFKAYSRPKEYLQIKTPIIIYIGLLQFWFDWDLVCDTANLLNNYTFVIIGAGSVPTNLPKNILHIESLPHDKIPPYLQYAHVGIIPFKNLPRIEYVETPLKYFEYLASGLPVVSVPFGTLKTMKYAKFGIDANTFAERIREGLLISEEEKDNYRAFAQQHSWDSIYTKFEDILKKEGIL